MTTSSDIKDALHQRYNKPSQGKDGERYVCIEEARSGAGFGGGAGQCDFIAINTWQGRGMELIGHEVKVSLADWRGELANPQKAERFRRYCRRWYVAVPADLTKKIKDEVPPAWGLLSVSEAGVCREVVKAPALAKPDEVPPWWWVGWLAQIDRQHKRDAQRRVQQLVEEERRTLSEQVKKEVERKRQYDNERSEELRANVEALRLATGIDLQHAWRGSIEQLKRAWALVKSGYNIDGLVGNLRRTADALEALKVDLDEDEIEATA